MHVRSTRSETRLSGLSLRTKLFAILGVVATAFLVAVAVGWLSISSVTSSAETDYTRAIVGQETSANAYNMHAGDVAAFVQTLTQIHDTATASEQAAVAAIDASYAAWKKLDAQLLKLAVQPQQHTAALHLLDGAYNSAGDGLSGLLGDYAAAASTAALKGTNAAKTTAQIAMGALALLALLIGGVGIVLLSRWLRPLRRMVEAANGIADGDVEQTVEVTSGDEIGQLGLAFQNAIEYLKRIAAAVGDVAQGAELQVGMIEQARLDTQATAAAAQQAQAVSVEGVATAIEATEAMRAVSEATGEVTEAIEAARAGEQGRGFAVVADEVRKLAEESQTAAVQIASLVEEIRAETQRTVLVVENGARRTVSGVAIVDRARESFEQIGVSVSGVTARIDAIAHSTEEVAALAERSSAATEQVAASTEQTSASTQEIAASAQDVATSAEQLAQFVSRFRVNA